MPSRSDRGLRSLAFGAGSGLRAPSRDPAFEFSLLFGELSCFVLRVFTKGSTPGPQLGVGRGGVGHGARIRGRPLLFRYGLPGLKLSVCGRHRNEQYCWYGSAGWNSAPHRRQNRVSRFRLINSTPAFPRIASPRSFVPLGDRREWVGGPVGPSPRGRPPSPPRSLVLSQSARAIFQVVWPL